MELGTIMRWQSVGKVIGASILPFCLGVMCMGILDGIRSPAIIHASVKATISCDTTGEVVVVSHMVGMDDDEFGFWERFKDSSEYTLRLHPEQADQYYSDITTQPEAVIIEL